MEPGGVVLIVLIVVLAIAAVSSNDKSFFPTCIILSSFKLLFVQANIRG